MKRRRRGGGGGGRNRERENALGMILMLHLVFTFQAGKSCNIQPKIQRAWILGALGCYRSPRPLSLFSLSLCSSLAREREKQYGGDRLHSRDETGGWVGGQMTMWRVGQGVSLKISQTAEHKAWPQQSSSIPSISSIFVAFSIMSECLPYKLMTKKVLELRLKKTYCFCHSNFPLHLPTGLLYVKSAIDFIKNIHGSRGLKVSYRNLKGSCPCV